MSVRWWPVAILLPTSIAGFATLRFVEVLDRQTANIGCAILVLATLILLGVWLVAFSRLPPRRRWRILGVSLGAASVTVALFFCVFRISGVTGDLVPIFSLRWFGRTPLEQSAESEPPSRSDRVPAVVPGLADYPQFFGPDRNGKLSGPRVRTNWAVSPPRQMWRRAVGLAWSGFAVAGRHAITQEQHEAEEAVVCYDVVTGEVRWTHRDRARYDSGLAGVGPRATPTIDKTAGRVFAQGATGILNCLDLATGRPLWSKNIVTDNGAVVPLWGVAVSPLLVEDLIIVGAGGPDGRSLVAYDQGTGAVRWHGGSDPMHWSSPIRATLAGRDQVLIFNARNVAGHDARTGAVLWTYPWRREHPHVCLPVLCGQDRVFVSSGYGTGCHLIRIEAGADGADGGFRANRLFKSLAMKAKFANAIESGGFVYGFDDGKLACVDLASGRRTWKRGRYGHGQLILVAGILLVTTEYGEVVLVAASPRQPRELGRITVFDGKSWNPPTLAGQYLILRNHEMAACYRLDLAR